MKPARALPLCAALVFTAFASGLSSPAIGKSGPIVVSSPPEDTLIRRVSYADLNLAAAPGQKRLVNRVRYAIDDFCFQLMGGMDGTFMLSTGQAQCKRASWDQAHPQIELAFQRAREIAASGQSSIIATALTITAPVAR
jgi:UrcA family protein